MRLHILGKPVKSCTQCGKCCLVAPCRLYGPKPCPSLVFHDGKYWCREYNIRGAELRAGKGCILGKRNDG